MLSNEPARTNLTDRECTKLLGGLIGSLALMAKPEDVRAAVRWWAATDIAWDALKAQVALTKQAADGVKAAAAKKGG